MFSQWNEVELKRKKLFTSCTFSQNYSTESISSPYCAPPVKSSNRKVLEPSLLSLLWVLLTYAIGFCMLSKTLFIPKSSTLFCSHHILDSLCFLSAATLKNFGDYFFLILKLVFNALFYLCVLSLIVDQLYGMEIVFNVIPGSVSKDTSILSFFKRLFYTYYQ